MFDDQPPIQRADLFGGTGTVAIWDLLKSATIAPFTAALACSLDPGGHVGAHVQEAYAEIVICISGEGRARVGRVEHPLGPGALVGLPLGETLALWNSSKDEPLRYLIIKAK